ncbi:MULTISPECIES: MerR family transcriptional regulator [unclassified Streptomyces]|uniref:MerR family transcriptional regulator n=1 Tax=unclassified Streptomyces TaxID=2593676 RepID=UPI0008238F7E|nr:MULTISPECIES: MerR family transcriptional regulator [unclassified Streptomyces]MYU02132.1 MerR family transcriptional regulator [Streptomyces sp. SID8350]SCK63529.1 DNA-binding transcriptional regulator, MerR family [Streptomyces sp. AmelKG-D3]
MRIGELSARTGASRRSLRYYEEQGLLVSSRSPSGQRLYEEEDVQRVRMVQAFLAAGMSSGTLVEMVPCLTEPSKDRARQALEIMAREQARLSEGIDGLTAARDMLDHLIDDNHTYLTRWRARCEGAAV